MASRGLVAEPPSSHQRRKDARPQELLDAALALFVDKGFAATRSEEVARRAGVSKGTLYLYYPSKEDLFKAVVRSNLNPILAAGTDLLGSFTGPTSALIARLVDHFWREVGSTPAGGIFKLMLAEARNFPELANFYREEMIAPSRELARQVLRRGIARGEFRPVDIEPAVHALLAPMQYAVLDRTTGGICGLGDDPAACAAFLRVQLDLLLDGLNVRDGANGRAAGREAACAAGGVPPPRA